MWLFERLKKRNITGRSAGPEESNGNQEFRLNILAVSVFLNDRFVLERLGRLHGWDLRFINSPRDAFRVAMEKRFDVILCDRNQPGYPWREVIERLAEGSPNSHILLVSPANEDYLWRDVVQLGGYDVLTRPLREEDALHAISAAAGTLASTAASH